MSARRRAALALAVLLSATPLPAAAQGFDFASRAGDGPVEVVADNGIEWHQDRRVFIARGNATAARASVTVTADVLTAHYREVGGRTDIWRLDAEGDVVIRTPTETATGASATYDVDSGRMVLKGAPRLVTPTDTVTASESLEYTEGTRVAVARGDAVASRDDKRIRSDVLTARFVDDGKGSLVLGQADASGNVVLTTAQDVVTGDEGHYDAESGIATLSGSVKITRDDNQLNGGYAQVNLKTGISKLFAAAPGTAGKRQRVQGLFVPESKPRAGAADEGR